MIHNMDEIGERVSFPVLAVKEDSSRTGWVVIDSDRRTISENLTQLEANFMADAINRFVGVACKEFVEDRLFGSAKKERRRGRN